MVSFQNVSSQLFVEFLPRITPSRLKELYFASNIVRFALGVEGVVWDDLDFFQIYRIYKFTIDYLLQNFEELGTWGSIISLASGVA